MRFDKIQRFKVDELLLDEGNYRFTKAANQPSCVSKIHDSNVPYFRLLMKSVAEDDLGEPLLVYRTNGENIVADGNRRLSVLKVLHNDDFAPTESIKHLAEELRTKHKISFSKIQAQVTEDKSLVSRTVYERHSGGKNGTNRIPWNAYAAARFGFVEQVGDNKEWRLMALLAKTEQRNSFISPFIDGSDFSFEVFRRIVRTALHKGKISEVIFSERGERIKKSAPSNLVKDAVNKTCSFLVAMQKKELTLSRQGENYADKITVDKFVEKFGLSPDNQKLENTKLNADQPGIGGDSASDTQTEGNVERSPDSMPDVGDASSEGEQSFSVDDKGFDSQVGANGVNKSEAILEALKALKSAKLNNLYNSLYIVSLRQHSVLMYAGAWSFFEVLSRLMGNEKDSFPAYFRSQMKDLGITNAEKKDIGVALDDILKYGNATKHGKRYFRADSLQLRIDFDVLEPLILAAIRKSTKP
jgi:hypothetical protein